jgi:hypothetical protein
MVVVKRKPGRPRKHPLPQPSPPPATTSTPSDSDSGSGSSCSSSPSDALRTAAVKIQQSSHASAKHNQRTAQVRGFGEAAASKTEMQKLPVSKSVSAISESPSPSSMTKLSNSGNIKTQPDVHAKKRKKKLKRMNADSDDGSGVESTISMLESSDNSSSDSSSSSSSLSSSSSSSSSGSDSESSNLPSASSSSDSSAHSKSSSKRKDHKQKKGSSTENNTKKTNTTAGLKKTYNKRQSNDPDALKKKKPRKRLTPAERELAKKVKTEKRNAHERLLAEKKAAREDRKRGKEFEDLIRKRPNEYVSYIHYLEQHKSYHVLERVSFPNVRLRLDHLHKDHLPGGSSTSLRAKVKLSKTNVDAGTGDGSSSVLPGDKITKKKQVKLPETKGCHMCFLLYKVFTGWYEKDMNKLMLEVDTSFVPKEGILDDPRTHLHELEVDGELVELPMLDVHAKPRKRSKGSTTKAGDAPKPKGTPGRKRKVEAASSDVENESEGEEHTDADKEEEEEEEEEEQKADKPKNRGTRKKSDSSPRATNKKLAAATSLSTDARPARSRNAPAAYVPTEVPLSTRKKRGAKRKSKGPGDDEEESLAEDIPVTASLVNMWLKELDDFLKETFKTEKMYGRVRKDAFVLVPSNAIMKYLQTVKGVTNKENLKFQAWVPRDHQETLYQHCKNIDWQKREERPENRCFWQFWEAGAGKTDGPQYVIMLHPVPEFVSIMDLGVLHQTIKHTKLFPQLTGRTLFRFIAYPHLRKMITKRMQRVVNKKPVTVCVIDEQAARTLLKGKVVQVDEIHRYRKLNPGMLPEIEALVKYPNYKFNLTGTPLMNHTYDIYYIMMFAGIMEIASLQEILNPKINKETGERYIPKGKIPKTKDEYLDLVKHLYRTTFWYIPDEEASIETKDVDIETELNWYQALWVVLLSQSAPRIGNLVFKGPTRNSFDSRTRPIANCMMDPNDPKKVLWGPKFEDIEKYLQRCFDTPNRERLPVALFSIFRERGTDAFYDWFKERPLGKKMRIEMIHGNVSATMREEMRVRFVTGQTDLLIMSPVGKQSFDLPDGAALILMEVLDSVGDEKQATGRVNRSGADKVRPNLVLELVRMVSVFPTFKNPDAYPTPQEVEKLWEIFCKYAKYTREELTNTDPGPDKKHPKPCWGIDIARDLIVELKRIKLTADQKRRYRNGPKYDALHHIIACLKVASIPYKDTNEEYKKEFMEMLDNLDKKNPSTNKKKRTSLQFDEQTTPSKRARRASSAAAAATAAIATAATADNDDAGDDNDDRDAYSDYSSDMDNGRVPDEDGDDDDSADDEQEYDLGDE